MLPVIRGIVKNDGKVFPPDCTTENYMVKYSKQDPYDPKEVIPCRDRSFLFIRRSGSGS